MRYKFYMTAELQSVEETKDLWKEVASVIDLPSKPERQPDLAYFTSRFVSTGTNLNNAHFLASELIKAGKSVPSKAVDIEHEEDKIIGHIYKHEFTDDKGNLININSYLQNKSISTLNSENIHIDIASVVYKTRFPDVAEEIQNGEWKVSMEAYFQDYDILVGSTILTKDEAKAMGFDVANESLYGQKAKIVKADEVVDEGTVARVLRGLCFSGVGIVKNPANPPSVVFEATASEEETEKDIVLDMDIIDSNNVTSHNIGSEEEANTLINPDTEGICVSYKKELLDTVIKNQDTEVIASEWCVEYEETCPVYGEFSNPDCLRFKKGDMVFVSSSESCNKKDLEDVVYSFVEDLEKNSKQKILLDRLLDLLK